MRLRGLTMPGPEESGIITPDERVKPCLDCEAVIPFDAEVCSLCGSRTRKSPDGEEAVRPCLACDALVPEQDLFCPACGDFALAIRSHERPGGRLPEPLGTREGRAANVLTRGVAMMVALIGVMMALAVAYELIGS